jgi:hypothetical protein
MTERIPRGRFRLLVQLLERRGVAEPGAQPPPERHGRTQQPGRAFVAAGPGCQPAEDLKRVCRAQDLFKLVLREQGELEHAVALGVFTRVHEVGE